MNRDERMRVAEDTVKEMIKYKGEILRIIKK